MPTFGPQLAIPFSPLPLRLTLTRPKVEGSNVLPETHDLMQQVLTMPPGVDPELWRAIVAHPDETVLWTAIVRGWEVGATDRSRYPGHEATIALIRRAVTDAQQERVLWTPVLDVLSRYVGNWSDAMLLREDPENPDAETRALPTPAEMADAAIPGIEGASTAEVTQALHYFRSPVFRKRLVRHVRTVDQDLVRETLRWPGGERDLARRTDLTPDLVERFYNWSLDRYEREAEQPITDAPKASQDHMNRLTQIADLMVPRYGAYPVSTRERLEAALETFASAGGATGYRNEAPVTAHLVARDPGITERGYDLIVEHVKEARTLASLLANPAMTAERRKPVHAAYTALGYNSWYALVGLSLIPEEVFLECVPHFLSDSGAIAAALKHTSATVAVAQRFIDLKFDSDAVRDTIVENPVFRRDPAIRARLLRCRVPQVLKPLIADSTPEEFAALWPRLLKQSPDTALELIEKGMIPDGIQIASSSVAPMLLDKGGDSSRVLRVMTILNELTPDDEMPDIKPYKARRAI